MFLLSFVFPLYLFEFCCCRASRTIPGNRNCRLWSKFVFHSYSFAALSVKELAAASVIKIKFFTFNDLLIVRHSRAGGESIAESALLQVYVKYTFARKTALKYTFAYTSRKTWTPRKGFAQGARRAHDGACRIVLIRQGTQTCCGLAFGRRWHSCSHDADFPRQTGQCHVR